MHGIYGKRVEREPIWESGAEPPKGFRGKALVGVRGICPEVESLWTIYRQSYAPKMSPFSVRVKICIRSEGR